MREIITVKCGGKEEIWTSRKKAMDFYFEAMLCCEGSEKERYTNIYCDLKTGNNYCSDEILELTDEEIEKMMNII